MEYLFIYGLLIDQFRNSYAKLVSNKTKTVSRAYTHGELYEIDHYPGLILSNNKDFKTYGFLCQILDQSIFKQLDHFEGIGDDYSYPYEYRREIIDVYSNNKQYKAWAYIYNWKVHKKNKIRNGDYLHFINNRIMPED